MSSPVLGIFADDLTGALDAAAPFAARGFKVRVSTTSDVPAISDDVDVVSVNMGTRHASSGDAESITRRVVSQLRDLGIQTLFNKVDSTLRGNPGVEVLHAAQLLGLDHAIICSAYPQNGRIISNGILYVDGTPITETDVGTDQLSPVPSDIVVEIVEESLSRHGLSDRAHVQTGTGSHSALDDKPVLLTLDASSGKDLHEISNRILSVDGVSLVAGSAGLSIACAEAMSFQSDRRVRRSNNYRNILLVTCSQRTMINDQLNHLNDFADYVDVEVSCEDALNGLSEHDQARLNSAVATSDLTIVRLASVREKLSQDNVADIAQSLVTNMGGIVRNLVEHHKPSVLAVIGGDTFAGISESCEISTIRLEDELQPGTAFGVIESGLLSGTRIVTRAGGFGNEQSITELVRKLNPSLASNRGTDPVQKELND